MGGGASRVNAARRSQDEADKLFDSMDESGHGELTFSQILSMIKKIPGKLDYKPDKVKATLKVFDTNHDNAINKAEFRNVMAAMSDKGGKNTQKNLTEANGRAFTFKDYMMQLAIHEQEAKETAEKEAQALREEEEKEEAERKSQELLDSLKPPTVEERKAEYWGKLEKQRVWNVTLNKRYAWHAAGEESLGEAIARAQANGKTPLLVDGSKLKVPGAIYEPTRLDEWFIAAGAEVLEARKMVEDEVTETRSRAQALKEARKQLILAMREGCTMYVRLGPKNTSFAGPDAYRFDETPDDPDPDVHKPMDIFNAQTVASLGPHTSGACEKPATLWKSSHPLARVLRENELDLKHSEFICGQGFGVVVSTQLPIEQVSGLGRSLTGTLPLEGHFQIIAVRVLQYNL